jgi:hypothetical protein
VLPTRRQVRGAVRRPFRALDPAAWLGPRRWSQPVPSGAALLCVYRPRFAGAVERVARDAQAVGVEVRLWALDDVVPSLRDHTVGSGPGPRTELLNRLFASLPDALHGPVVLWDDDVAFARGDLGQLLRAVDAAGFDLAQPSHGPGSHRAWPFTFSRALTLARRTGWIESGPVVVVGPGRRDEVLPLPDDFGMGWGIEVLWHDLEREGCRLGIVDAVSIHHLAVTGADYDVLPERARARALLQARGSRVTDQQELHGTWRPWQRQPPWETG